MRKEHEVPACPIRTVAPQVVEHLATVGRLIHRGTQQARQQLEASAAAVQARNAADQQVGPPPAPHTHHTLRPFPCSASGLDLVWQLCASAPAA